MLQEYSRKENSQNQTDEETILQIRQKAKMIYFYCNKEGHLKRDCYFYKKRFKKGPKVNKVRGNSEEGV